MNGLGDDLGMMRGNPKKYGLTHEILKESEATVLHLQRQVDSASAMLQDGHSSEAHSMSV